MDQENVHAFYLRFEYDYSYNQVPLVDMNDKGFLISIVVYIMLAGQLPIVAWACYLD